MKDDDGKWWVINEEGEAVLSCDWSVVGDFHDGLAFVIDASQNIGFIDKTGTVVVKFQAIDSSKQLYAMRRVAEKDRDPGGAL